MDIPTVYRVLGRFKVLIAAAFVLAIVLALLSYVKVDVNNGVKFKYRTNETWASSTQLLVSGPDLIYEDRYVPQAQLFAKFALGDRVRALMLRDGPIHGLLDAGPLPATSSSDEFLPIVNIVGYARSRDGAMALADRDARALKQFINQRQRVYLTVVKHGPAQLTSPRSKTLPVLVFLLVMAAGIGLAFVLESVRPRIHAIPDAAPRTRVERRNERRRNKRVS
ncbi:MAG TPA: hypothetical protein VNN80_19100 [Polyangiaceae bacterium]|nr:hypothetical protein [Polyangiaceae bacterium]